MKGREFENLFLRFLIDSGRAIWAHRFEPNRDGSQPCDIIALDKNCNVHFVDCKVVSNEGGIFPLSRIEFNQEHFFQSMAQYQEIECGFAIYYAKLGRIYWVDWREIERMRAEGKKALNCNEIERVLGEIKK